MVRKREYPSLPMVGAGALIHKGHKILLVKRRNEPNKGRWALPGGLVELGESVEDAVRREVKEEVGLDVRLEGLLDVLDDIHYDREGRTRYHYILVDYLAAPHGGRLKLNSESAESRWFDPAEVPGINASDNTKDVVKRYLESSARKSK